ncbi:MAG: pentapeptide repeat-containing protein [Planctomycetes bacterium]|nr:pentapeptide repeat-containing protein [Planctomycetota bacterium]
MENLRNLQGRGARLPSADLEGTDLEGALLHKAILDDASLISATMTGTNLSYSSLVGTKLHAAELSRADLTHCNLSGAHLHGTSLDQTLLYGVKLSADTLFLGVVWGIAGEMLRQQFEKAASVFRTLRTHFRSLSNLREAENFYYWEMTALHLRAINGEFLPKNHWLRQLCSWVVGLRSPTAIGWAIHRWVWGYGVRPWRTLSWMFFVVVLFGIDIYPWVGMLENGKETHSLASGLALSAVTFTTLGYGNQTPCGPIGEFLAGLEAMLGVLLAGMFVVALATRHIHLD